MHNLLQKDVIRLDKIYYDYDKCNIKPRAGEELRRLVNLMNDYPDMIIELSSHTDSRGSNAYNTSLVAMQGRRCRRLYRRQGISTSRIVPGYSESKLVNECADGVNCSEKQSTPRTEEPNLVSWSAHSCPEVGGN